MTPYAILTVKPADADETIRKAYHAIAREEHPDKTGLAVTERWQAATTAYAAVKTAAKREDWLKRQSLLSGFCADCAGSGVRGSRMFKGRVKLCAACEGAGRR